MATVVQVTCEREGCGRVFDRKQYNKPRPEHWRSFCSRACAHYREGREYKTACDGCKAPFDPPRLMRARNRYAYCSAECKRRNEQPRVNATRPHPWSRNTDGSFSRTCRQCEHSYGTQHANSKYCSVECKLAAANARRLARYADSSYPKSYANGVPRVGLRFHLLQTQSACAICGVDFSEVELRNIHADHCHETGVLRSLLCSVCNLGLGYFRDDPTRLRAAADYIEQYKKAAV